MSLTEELRAEAERRGIAYTKGYVVGDARTDEESVTTLWPVEGDAMSSLTFVEDDDVLWCEDSMSVEQCIGAVMAGV